MNKGPKQPPSPEKPSLDAFPPDFPIVETNRLRANG